jgi:hypothetical protein
LPSPSAILFEVTILVFVQLKNEAIHSRLIKKYVDRDKQIRLALFFIIITSRGYHRYE